MLDAGHQGVSVICPTPFGEDGALDLASAARMAEAFRAAGAASLTVLGVMGEAPKLDQDESVELLRTVLRHAGGLPVVVGLSAPGSVRSRVNRSNHCVESR